MNKYSFKLDIECHDNSNPDMERVEYLLDLHFQDLLYDEAFVATLKEKHAITIQVTRMVG